MKKLRCKLLGHHLVSTKSGNQSTKKYVCKYCKQKYTEDGYGKIVRLTEYWETNNLLFEKHLQQKRAL